MNLEALGITKEEVLNLAAQKLADYHAGDEYLEGLASSQIERKIDALIVSIVTPKIDAFLSAQLEALVSKEFIPVDMRGEGKGKPTTIREQLTLRAKEYWETPVDHEGNPSTRGYGTKPRHEHMFGNLVASSFAAAVSQEIVNIAGALKDALIDDCNASVRKKIDELIRVKTQK